MHYGLSDLLVLLHTCEHLCKTYFRHSHWNDEDVGMYNMQGWKCLYSTYHYLYHPRHLPRTMIYEVLAL